MTDDGKEYEYVYDAFGRLRKIKNTSNQALVSEYWYNGLGHRITWHADTTRSGGGAPDGSVNTDDPKVHFVYNERWQQVAAYRAYLHANTRMILRRRMGRRLLPARAPAIRITPGSRDSGVVVSRPHVLGVEACKARSTTSRSETTL